MKTTIIKAIFTNLLFVIGVILMVVGFIRGTTTAVNSVVFDKYPLQQWDETRCQMDIAPIPVKSTGEPAQVDQQDIDAQRQKCQELLEKTRQTKQVEDISQSISFFVAGTALAFSFKRFIFTKETA